ncbi:MAG: hypothetical protein FJW31_22995 [Acidobacteria bacterium]|nr:hypothetical protein [Acidobacteriota bacterium]
MKPHFTALLFMLLTAAACSNAPAPKSESAAPPPPPAAGITQFYASPATVSKGGRSLLCYGVEAAASVRLDPPVEQITPSLARCIELRPTATTTYTLYAKNRAGAEVSRAVTVTVDPKLRKAAAAAPSTGLILFFTAVQTRVPKGATATLCYGVNGASSVTINPAVSAAALALSERMCLQTKPQASATYTLTAKSAAGETSTERVKITVE